MMEYIAQQFVTRLDVQDLIAVEVKTSTAHTNALGLTVLLEDIVILALNVRYNAIKEEVKNPLLNLIEESIIVIV